MNESWTSSHHHWLSTPKTQAYNMMTIGDDEDDSDDVNGDEFDEVALFRNDFMSDEPIPHIPLETQSNAFSVPTYTGQTMEERKQLLVGSTQLDKMFNELISRFDPVQEMRDPSQFVLLAQEYRDCVNTRFQEIKIHREENQHASHEYLMGLHQGKSLLRAETNTWDLSAKLIDDLKGHDHRLMNRNALEKKLNDLKNPSELWRVSHKQIAKLIFEIREDLRMQQIVIQWLESIAERDNQDDSYYPLSARGVIADPDASIRDNIESGDKEKESEILQKIWRFLRSGQISQAQHYCREVGQYWRAATIQGGEYYHKILSLNNENEYVLEVNQNRFVYCHSLMKLAKESKNNLERAIYGVLCGDLKSMAEACVTWEDYLWAYLKANISSNFNIILKDYIDKSSDDFPYIQGVLEGQSNVLSIEQILNNLRNYPEHEIKYDSGKPYHEIQAYIILDQQENLIDLLEKFVSNKNETNHVFVADIRRFSCHFSLFLNQYYELPERSRQSIDKLVISYIHYLTATKQYDLVPFYTNQLSNNDDKIQIHAAFLLAVERANPNMTQDDICIALENAKRFNLDTFAITKSLVETRLKQTVPQHTTLTSYNYSKKDQTITELDRDKIHALRWLCVGEDQYTEALIQSNYLIREFVNADKVKAVSMILNEILPAQIYRFRNDDMERLAIEEHVSWKYYLEAHQKYAAWFGQYTRKPVERVVIQDGTQSAYIEAQREKKSYLTSLADWERKEQELRNEAKEVLRRLLAYDWLQSNGISLALTVDGSDLRHKCIPEIVFMFCDLLFTAGSYNDCLRVADRVASDDLQLYTCFKPHELRSFLVLMKEAELKLITQL